jgi:O-antigen ligase
VSALTRITYVLLVAFTMASIVAWQGNGLLQFSAGPINVNLFDLLFLLAMVLLVREMTLEGGQGIPRGNRLSLAFVALYCGYQIAVVLPVAVAFHGLAPISVARSLEDRLALLLVPFVYLVVARYMEVRRIIAWVNLAALLLVGYALYRYATVGIVGETETGSFRVREVWGGATLLFGFLILTSLFLRRPTLWSYVMAVIGLLGMALTNHRSAYVALIVVVPPLLISSRRAAQRIVVITVVLVCAAGVVFLFAPTVRDSVAYSFSTMINPSADQNAQDRVDRSKLGLQYFAAHPLGDYTWNQQYYLVNVGSATFEPHNFIVQLLGQQGIVATAFFLLMLAATAVVGWVNQRRDRTSAVMLAYLAYYLVFCLFNTSLINVNNVLLLIVPLALILVRNAALARGGEPEVDAPPAGAEGGLVASRHGAL